MTDEYLDDLDDADEFDAEDEFDADEEQLDFDEEFELDEEDDLEGEFEEITSDEVDRVLESLEELIDSVESENIRAFLEGAMNNIFYLVYNDDDLEPEGDDDLTAEAA